MLPASLLRETGVPRNSKTRRFRLADGGVREMPITVANLHIDEDVLPVVVAEGPDDTYLLGATSLQMFGLIADTTNHRLVPDTELTI